MTSSNPIDLATGSVIELDDNQLQKALHDVNQMADAARKVIVPYFRSFGELENKLDGSISPTKPTGQTSSNRAITTYDPVTRADKEAEQAIVNVIKQCRPDDGIFGEEYGYHAGSSGLCWVIDPIDGTRGFVCGLPTWGTLIALHNGEKSILGVMDQPILEERFIGSPVAAQLHTHSGVRALSVRTTQSLADAWVCVTTPDIFAGSKAAVLVRLNEQVASIRYGTDCYGYAMLAAGMVDLVVEPGLEAYDIQALIPIIEFAGGVITDWQGRPVTNGGDVIAAATPELHEQALALVTSCNP